MFLRSYCRQYKGVHYEYTPAMGYCVREASLINEREWIALNTLANLVWQQIIQEDEAYDLVEGFGWIEPHRQTEIDGIFRGYDITWHKTDSRIRVSTTFIQSSSLGSIANPEKDTLQRATRFCIFVDPCAVRSDG
jgi:hypothetical protein